MLVLSAHHVARRRADMEKQACRGSQRSARPVQRQPTVKAVMPSRLDPPDMPRLDVLDEEFGEDAAVRRRRTGARLLMLAIVALGLAGRIRLCRGPKRSG